MQFGPLIGIAVALACIIVGNALEGGHLSSMVGGSAAIIVLGGTIGAVIVQYPGPTLMGALGAVGTTFKKPKVESAKLVDEIVEYANRARRDGILALEKRRVEGVAPVSGQGPDDGDRRRGLDFAPRHDGDRDRAARGARRGRGQGVRSQRADIRRRSGSSAPSSGSFTS